MNISLTPELEKYVYGKLDGGFYSSVSEIIREALRVMLQQESFLKTRQKLNFQIEQGLEDLEKGNKISGQESYEKLSQTLDEIENRK